MKWRWRHQNLFVNLKRFLPIVYKLHCHLIWSSQIRRDIIFRIPPPQLFRLTKGQVQIGLRYQGYKVCKGWKSCRIQLSSVKQVSTTCEYERSHLCYMTKAHGTALRQGTRILSLQMQLLDRAEVMLGIRWSE